MQPVTALQSEYSLFLCVQSEAELLPLLDELGITRAFSLRDAGGFLGSKDR